MAHAGSAESVHEGVGVQAQAGPPAEAQDQDTRATRRVERGEERRGLSCRFRCSFLYPCSHCPDTTTALADPERCRWCEAEPAEHRLYQAPCEAARSAGSGREVKTCIRCTPSLITLSLTRPADRGRSGAKTIASPPKGKELRPDKPGVAGRHPLASVYYCQHISERRPRPALTPTKSHDCISAQPGHN